LAAIKEANKKVRFIKNKIYDYGESQIIPAISEVQQFVNNLKLYPVELEANYEPLLGSIMDCISSCMYQDLVFQFVKKTDNCTWNSATEFKVFIYRSVQESTPSIQGMMDINQEQELNEIIGDENNCEEGIQLISVPYTRRQLFKQSVDNIYAMYYLGRGRLHHYAYGAGLIGLYFYYRTKMESPEQNSCVNGIDNNTITNHQVRDSFFYKATTYFYLKYRALDDVFLHCLCNVIKEILQKVLKEGEQSINETFVMEYFMHTKNPDKFSSTFFSTVHFI
jgi:hypothetical protein